MMTVYDAVYQAAYMAALRVLAPRYGYAAYPLAMRYAQRRATLYVRGAAA